MNENDTHWHARILPLFLSHLHEGLKQTGDNKRRPDLEMETFEWVSGEGIHRGKKVKFLD